MKEIVFTVGYPGAGKSSIVQEYVNKGYTNLNRDDKGGSIKDLHEMIPTELQKSGKIILDNTYLTVEGRKELVDIATKENAQLTCLWIDTSFEDCQFNICMRVANGGRDVPVPALYAGKKAFVKPKATEGFKLVVIPFTRKMPAEYKNKALILDYDGTVRTCPSDMKYPTLKEHISLIPGVKEKIQWYKDQGYIILGASNQSGVGKGVISKEDMDKLFVHTNELLSHDIDVLYCPDNSFPIKSYDRKPLPGMGVKHVFKYKLNPADCIMVGDSTSDKTFATRCGFQFIHADNFV